MGNKKLGRPTDNPKSIGLKIWMDKDSAARLEKSAAFYSVSKSELIRRGIRKMYEELP